MISALFDKSFLYDLLVIFVILLLIVLAIKSKAFRIALFVVIYLFVILTGILSWFQINKYLKASGGVIGSLPDIFVETNTVTTDGLQFDFKDVVLKDNGVGYEAKFISDKPVVLDDSTALVLYINGRPVDILEFNKDYLIADFDYNFYDVDKKVVLNDTLRLRFAFYEKQTVFLVQTNGGSDAAKKWDYFFNKNGFIVELKEDNSQNTSSSFLNQFVKIDFVIEENGELKTLNTSYLKPGRSFSTDFKVESSRYEISSWLLKDESVDIYNVSFKENTVLKGVYTIKTYTVTFNFSKNPVAVNNNSTVLTFEGDEILKLDFDPGIVNECRVCGYSKDNKTLLPSNFKVTGDMTVNVIWKSMYTRDYVLSYFIVGALTNNTYFFDGVTDIKLSYFNSFSAQYNQFKFVATYTKNGVSYDRKQVTISSTDSGSNTFVNEILAYLNSVEKNTLGTVKPFFFQNFKAKCMEFTNYRWTTTVK